MFRVNLLFPSSWTNNILLSWNGGSNFSGLQTFPLKVVCLGETNLCDGKPGIFKYSLTKMTSKKQPSQSSKESTNEKVYDDDDDFGYLMTLSKHNIDWWMNWNSFLQSVIYSCHSSSYQKNSKLPAQPVLHRLLSNASSPVSFLFLEVIQ